MAKLFPLQARYWDPVCAPQNKGVLIHSSLLVGEFPNPAAPGKTRLVVSSPFQLQAEVQYVWGTETAGKSEQGGKASDRDKSLGRWRSDPVFQGCLSRLQ